MMNCCSSSHSFVSQWLQDVWHILHKWILSVLACYSFKNCFCFFLFCFLRTFLDLLLLVRSPNILPKGNHQRLMEWNFYRTSPHYVAVSSIKALYRVWALAHALHDHMLHAVFSKMSKYTVWVKKSSPPKTFCNIFTQVKYISMKFCQYVARLYGHIFTNFGRFILIFKKMALIFLRVPIIFNVFSFKFHQVESP